MTENLAHFLPSLGYQRRRASSSPHAVSASREAPLALPAATARVDFPSSPRAAACLLGAANLSLKRLARSRSVDAGPPIGSCFCGIPIWEKGSFFNSLPQIGPAACAAAPPFFSGPGCPLDAPASYPGRQRGPGQP